MWDSVKSLLSSAAPLLGSAVGGPMGGMVGNWIASELGDDVDPSDPVALEKAIKADPDALLKLRELETRHKEKLQEFEAEIFRNEIADKDSARNRELEIVKATGKRDYFQPSLALAVTVGFFGILAFLLNVEEEISTMNMTIINIMIGALGVNFNNVIGYYFGSSKSSADKTKLTGK